MSILEIIFFFSIFEALPNMLGQVHNTFYKEQLCSAEVFWM